MLDAFVGTRLRAARVMVLAMAGGRKLASTLDSQVLFSHTRAHLVALLDNQRVEAVQSTWQQAQEAAAQGELQAAIDIVVDGIGKETPEADYVRSWLTRALERGLDGRIRPTGLERADIVEYLPVENFVAGAASWTELRDQHREARETPRSNTPKDFKHWLELRYRADFTPDNLRAAVAGADIPPDIARLMNELEALSAAPRPTE